jgi:hypothetical protein
MDLIRALEHGQTKKKIFKKYMIVDVVGFGSVLKGEIRGMDNIGCDVRVTEGTATGDLCKIPYDKLEYIK